MEYKKGLKRATYLTPIALTLVFLWYVGDFNQYFNYDTSFSWSDFAEGMILDTEYEGGWKTHAIGYNLGRFFSIFSIVVGILFSICGLSSFLNNEN
jgi:hypothetical protein